MNKDKEKILGEQVLGYIDELEKENKELKEKVAELEKENKYLQEGINSVTSAYFDR